MRSDEEREYTAYVAGRLTKLHRTAYLLCGDAHRADDIVQAALTSLYVRWRRVRAADNIDAYVQRVLVRRYLDERRLRWARVRLGDEPAQAVAVAGAEHGIVERDALMTALRALPNWTPCWPAGASGPAGTGRSGRAAARCWRPRWCWACRRW